MKKVIKYVIRTKNEELFYKTLEHITLSNSRIVCLIETDEMNNHVNTDNIEYIFVERDIEYYLNKEIEKNDYDYITFIEEGMTYSKDYQLILDQYIESGEKLISFAPIYVNPEQVESKYKISPKLEGKYHVLTDHRNVQLLLKAYFIHKSLLNDIRFNNEFNIDYKLDFIMNLLIKNPSYYYTTQASVYYYLGEDDDHSTNLYQYDKRWYSDSVNNFLTKLLDKAKLSHNEMVDAFIKCCVIYFIFAKFNSNMNDRQKNILNKEEAKQFFNDVGRLLSHIEDYYIFKDDCIGAYVMEKSLKYLLLKLKKNHLDEQMNYTYDQGSYYYELNNQLVRICDIKDETVFIQAINYINGNLEIDGLTSLSDFLEHKDIHICADMDGKKYDAVASFAYPLKKCFDVTYNHKYPFHISIPIDLKKNKQKFTIQLHVEQDYINLSVKFAKAAARLCNGKKSPTYWMFDKNRMLRQANNVFYISKISVLEHMKKELRLNLSRYKKSKNKNEALYNSWLRICYYVMKFLFGKRRIWVTFDKIYKAGDNGEYMYHYMKENVPGVKIYYIIQKDVPDYYRLKEKHENILIHNSFKCRLYSLLAEVVLATHVDIISYCGFGGDKKTLFRDLFNAKIVCIQHGLTIQDIAQYQNRLYDNTLFYCCASKYEIKNISKPMYDYKEEDMALVGLARYDGLKSNDQKQILITPTWRRDVVNSSIAFVKKKHNAHFKDSTYYKIYNGLINDPVLIECARKNNYKIIYLLHPAMSSQSVDYERNDYVEIVESTGNMSYEKILTESSLIVTDYSGVQFDFAYMRKPILYYHPDALPPHYESGGIDYETMGFGPILKNHEAIVESLCYYMERECEIEEEYVKRANDFFEFDDYNNCQRIYRSVEDFLKRT